jgi:hypothetical protein
MAERLFPNAWILATTHSPFVIGSASDAWIHPLRLEGGRATVDAPVPSARGRSYAAIVEGVMGVPEDFDVATELELAELRRLRTARLSGDVSAEASFVELAGRLGARSTELATLVGAELRQLRRALAVSGSP